MNQIAALDESGMKELKRAKERILSSYLELPLQDGMIPASLLRSRTEERLGIFQLALNELKNEGLVELISFDGYQIGVKLTLRSAIPLAFGSWPWD